MKKIISMLLVCVMVLGLFAVGASAESKDTIVVMAPPVTGGYLEKLETWKADFEAEHPNLTIEIIGTSWDEHNGKLSTMPRPAKLPTSLRFPPVPWVPS